MKMLAGRAAELFEKGYTVSEVAHALGKHGRLVSGMLEDMGVLQRCADCEIILRPYDPNDRELLGVGDYTRNGSQCVACESGNRLTRVPLPVVEHDEINLRDSLHW